MLTLRCTAVRWSEEFWSDAQNFPDGVIDELNLLIYLRFAEFVEVAVLDSVRRATSTSAQLTDQVCDPISIPLL